MSPVEIVAGPKGARDLALVQGVMPSSVEWDEIERRGLTVNVLEMPGGERSLEPLVQWADRIRHLSVNSYSCSDLRALPGFTRLESLAIGGHVTHAPEDFAPPLLRSFSGPYRRFEALAESPHLHVARLTLGRNTVPERLGGSLVQLALLSAVSLQDLRMLESLGGLKELTIHGAKDLDLSELSKSASLVSLHMESCGRLTSAEAMLTLARLESLWLEDITEIEPIQPLVGLKAEVRVVGRNPFGATFRSSVGRQWAFPPGR